MPGSPLSARYIYYSGTKLLPVEATILADDHRNEIIRVPFAPSRNRLGPIPYHHLSESTRVFFSRQEFDNEFVNFRDYSYYTILFSRPSLVAHEHDSIVTKSRITRGNVSVNSPVIPILDRCNGERWSGAANSLLRDDKRDPFCCL